MQDRTPAFHRSSSALLVLVACLPPALFAEQNLSSAIAKVIADCDGTTRQGTGFVVAVEPEIAYVATAKHTVEGCESLQVTFPGHPHKVTGVSMDEVVDLALLKIPDPPPDTRSLPISVDEIRAGSDARIIGFPQRSTALRYASVTISTQEGSRLAATFRHVVEGCSKISLDWQGHQSEIEDMVMDRQVDLALLRVLSLPTEVKMLPVSKKRVKAGSVASLVGFPQRALKPRFETVTLSNLEGSILSLTGTAAPGSSGSPVLQDNTVVAMVTEASGGYLNAIPGTMLRLILEGWLSPELLRELHGLSRQLRTHKMIEFTAGKFDRSSLEHETTVHTVEILPFQLSETEVTVGQYRTCVDAGACKEPADDGYYCNWKQAGRDEHPINCVSSVQRSIQNKSRNTLTHKCCEICCFCPSDQT